MKLRTLESHRRSSEGARTCSFPRGSVGRRRQNRANPLPRKSLGRTLLVVHNQLLLSRLENLRGEDSKSLKKADQDTATESRIETTSTCQC
jgi:hypothetical protein